MTRPIGYIEVTVAMSLMAADGSMLHDEMADVTIAFGIRSAPPPEPITEELTREVIRVNLGRMMAAVESVLLMNGAVHLGQVEDRMTDHGREYAKVHSGPVTARLTFVDEPVSS